MGSLEIITPDSATKQGIDLAAAYLNHLRTYFRMTDTVQEAIKNTNKLLANLRRLDANETLSPDDDVFLCYQRLSQLSPRVADLFRDEWGLAIGRSAVSLLQNLDHSELWRGTTDNHG